MIGASTASSAIRRISTTISTRTSCSGARLSAASASSSPWKFCAITPRRSFLYTGDMPDIVVALTNSVGAFTWKWSVGCDRYGLRNRLGHSARYRLERSGRQLHQGSGRFATIPVLSTGRTSIRRVGCRRLTFPARAASPGRRPSRRSSAAVIAQRATSTSGKPRSKPTGCSPKGVQFGIAGQVREANVGDSALGSSGESSGGF